MSARCGRCGERKDFEYCEICNTPHCMCNYNKHSRCYDKAQGLRAVKVRGGDCAVVALALIGGIAAAGWGVIEMVRHAF